VLVAYERDLTRRAQAIVLEALVDGRLLVTAALSLAVGCAELGRETRELVWLIYDWDGPSACCRWRWAPWRSAPRRAAASKRLKTSRAVIHEAHAASAIVLTYDPDRYTGHRIDVVDLRP
jgi:hypothetical protein